MEPLKLTCNLKCPEKGQKANVEIELDRDKGCTVTSCSLLANQPVNCALTCLEGTVAGPNPKK